MFWSREFGSRRFRLSTDWFSRMSRLPAAEDYVKLYTDGACSGNPGPGGWAFILEHPASGKILERFGADPHTTNNRMEIEGALRGLEILKRPCRVELVTDSQYLAKGINEWLPGWRANGYRRREGNKLKPLVNDDLWRAVDSLLARHQVRVVHVRGHAGHPQNERCDQLAVAAYKSLGRRSASSAAQDVNQPGRQARSPERSVQQRSWSSPELAESKTISQSESPEISAKPAEAELPAQRPPDFESIATAPIEPVPAGSAKKPRSKAASPRTPRARKTATPAAADPLASAVPEVPAAEPVKAIEQVVEHSEAAPKRRTAPKARSAPKKRTPAKRQPEIDFPDPDHEPREPARWDPDDSDA